ncbi:ras-related protein Rab-40B isoform X1 [Prionailurus viverrinus]|uniref:ras-related protein Rab-40B isoform X1 n=1 Tax=Prionailurus viverrinus TaxID=61388 RepID=UPI001FF138B4|nr:ras-related protein Rab-40B isoform X1 [Prionailurus viverrinus]
MWVQSSPALVILFPAAAGTHRHKQQKCVLSHFGGQEPELQCHQGWAPSEASRGGSFLPLPVPGGCRQLLACGPVTLPPRGFSPVCPGSSPLLTRTPVPGLTALRSGLILTKYICKRPSPIRTRSEHAPGVPKILVGNRLHLAFKRQVPTEQAQAYAARLGVTFFEVSPLCNFNITESFTELARTVLLRHGMDRLWRPSKVLTLQDLCCRAVVSCTPVHLVDKLPLPMALRSHLKSFSMASGLNARMMHGRSYSLTTSSTHKRSSLRKVKATRPPQSPPKRCPRNSCKVS